MDVFDEAAWRDVVAWLRREAPGSATLLLDPVPGAAAGVESASGLVFPGQLRGFLDSVGGMDDGDGDGLWLSYWACPPMTLLERTLRRRASRVELELAVAREGSAFTAAGEQVRGWLDEFFMLGDFMTGDYLAVDLREGPARGSVVGFSRDEGVCDPPWWGSVNAMVAEVAESLRSGRPLRGSVPVVRDAYLEWASAAVRNRSE